MIQSLAISVVKNVVKRECADVDTADPDSMQMIKSRVIDALDGLVQRDVVKSYVVDKVEHTTRHVNGINMENLPKGTMPGDMLTDRRLVIAVDESQQKGLVLGSADVPDGSLVISLKVQPTTSVSFITMTVKTSDT